MNMEGLATAYAMTPYGPTAESASAKRQTDARASRSGAEETVADRLVRLLSCEMILQR